MLYKLNLVLMGHVEMLVIQHPPQVGLVQKWELQDVMLLPVKPQLQGHLSVGSWAEILERRETHCQILVLVQTEELEDVMLLPVKQQPQARLIAGRWVRKVRMVMALVALALVVVVGIRIDEKG